MPRPTRPVIAADVDRLHPDATIDVFEQMELAHVTAAAVVDAARTDGTQLNLVQLAEVVGLDTLAELWRQAPADSLPGALWALYLLRTWCLRSGEDVAHLYAAGRGLAPVDEVVAGAPEAAGPAEVAALADAVLAGLHRGDFGVALQRAASFFRVVAAGRELLAPDGALGAADRERAARNRQCADSLARAAAAWHAGTLR